MELNETLPEGHEHATTSMKVVLLVFVLALLAVLGYFVWYQNTTPDTADYTAPNVSKKAAETAKAVECGDDAYAFSLTFGDKWDGYKVKEVAPDYAIVTCYFTMPTASADTVWTTAADDHDSGYASVFAVSVYTPTQWTAAQEEANKPTELGHNDNYYWGWSQAQAIPDDLAGVYADAKNVVASFEIVS
jgi:hypothetical protein